MLFDRKSKAQPSRPAPSGPIQVVTSMGTITYDDVSQMNKPHIPPKEARPRLIEINNTMRVTNQAEMDKRTQRAAGTLMEIAVDMRFRPNRHTREFEQDTRYLIAGAAYATQQMGIRFDDDEKALLGIDGPDNRFDTRVLHPRLGPNWELYQQYREKESQIMNAERSRQYAPVNDKSQAGQPSYRSANVQTRPSTSDGGYQR